MRALAADWPQPILVAFLFTAVSVSALPAQEPDGRSLAFVPYAGVALSESSVASFEGLVLGIEYVWRKEDFAITPLDFSVLIPVPGAYVRLSAGARVILLSGSTVGLLAGVSRFDVDQPIISARATTGRLFSSAVDFEARLEWHPRPATDALGFLVLGRLPIWF